MVDITPLPSTRGVLADLRGPDRGLRVSTHAQQGLAVLSVWRHDRCVASVQLGADEIATLIAVLAAGLAELAPASTEPAPDTEIQPPIAS